MVTKVFQRLWCEERAQSLIEMAFLTGVLLLILGGVLDLGRAFNNYIIITNAAREGARYGSRFPSDTTNIQNAAIAEAANSGVTLVPEDIVPQCYNGAALIACPAPGYDNTETNYSIRVSIEYTFNTIMAGIVGVPELTLRSSVEMVIFGVD